MLQRLRPALSRSRARQQRGQAAVEAALTLPLALFCLLGALQLFMMLQGRIMAHYAAFRAVRVGSVNHADCEAMQDAALAALLPSFSATYNADLLVENFGERKTRQYRYTDANEDTGHSREVFWLTRNIVAAPLVDGEDKIFDQYDATSEGASRLDAQLVFWYPLKVPFVNWVMSRMFLAYFGIQQYTAVNPLMPTQEPPNWPPRGPIPDGAIQNELGSRVQAEEYEFPVVVSYSMRMMSPARSASGRCP